MNRLSQPSSTAAAQAETRRAFLRYSGGLSAAAGALGLIFAPDALAGQIPGRQRVTAGKGPGNTGVKPNASGSGGLNLSELRKQFSAIRKHENDHAAFFAQLLGSSNPMPTLRNLEATSIGQFLVMSTIFENVGVAAYLGAAPIINSRRTLAQAGSIATIEARHAGFLNTTLGFPVSQNNESFETPFSPPVVVTLIAPYLQDPMSAAQLAQSISNEPSDANDLRIAQFASVLEQLEARFYNLNVQRLLGV